jgi:hypothetical protein
VRASSRLEIELLELSRLGVELADVVPALAHKPHTAAGIDPRITGVSAKGDFPFLDVEGSGVQDHGNGEQQRDRKALHRDLRSRGWIFVAL